MVKKPKIAIISLTCDEGCEFVLLDLGKRFFNFLKKVELIDFSLIEDMPFPKGKIDVVFIEGNPITNENVKILEEARKKAKILVAMGNCAALGGIPEMKNYQGKEKTIRFIYKHTKGVANPEIKEINNFVKVDFVIPGCPINGEEFLKFAGILIKGKIPKVCQSPVCSECGYKGTKNCFLVRKKVCFGLITLAGCNAICTKSDMPCWGCRGLFRGANVKILLQVLEKFEKKEEIEEKLEIFGIKDDVEKILKA